MFKQLLRTMLERQLRFWFQESAPASGHCWKLDPAFDSQLVNRFCDLVNGDSSPATPR